MSLPATKPIPAEEQDEAAIPPVANSPVKAYWIYPEKLKVLEKKEIIIVYENKTAFFDCKINIELNPTCSWRRNGIKIYDDQRTTITNDGEWQRLHITNVQLKDHGLYVLECRHLDMYISVHHRLYVCPQTLDLCAFYYTPMYSRPFVRKHLTNTRVYKKNTIKLEAIFEYEAEAYIWYKNNDELHLDSRTTINNLATRASIYITDATKEDSGIYYVIAITNYGYFSSSADVIVGKPNEKRPLLPIIEVNPPEDVEGYKGEEIRICAKVQTDANSMTRWARNKRIIVTDEVKQIDYGNNYIGIMIESPKISSAGDYELVLANSQIPNVVKANLHLTVIEPPPPLPTEVRVLRRLESVVACCGASVIFDCSFALEDYLYFYVVWHVGRYRILRTNSLFTVICGRGQFLLFIKRFEPCMSGEVICELRRSYPNQASVKVQRSYAYLTCVPPCVVQDRPSYGFESKLIFSKIPSPSCSSFTESEENPDAGLDEMVSFAYIVLNMERE